MFLGELAVQTACNVLAALGCDFLAAAGDLILNQILPVLISLIQVLGIKFSKSQQTPTDWNNTEYSSNCFSLQCEKKCVQSKKLSFYLVTLKFNRRVAHTDMGGGEWGVSDFPLQLTTGPYYTNLIDFSCFLNQRETKVLQIKS